MAIGEPLEVVMLNAARDQSILPAHGHDRDPAHQPIRDPGVRIAAAVASRGTCWTASGRVS